MHVTCGVFMRVCMHTYVEFDERSGRRHVVPCAARASICVCVCACMYVCLHVCVEFNEEEMRKSQTCSLMDCERMYMNVFTCLCAYICLNEFGS